jgi:hypothetical protein
MGDALHPSNPLLSNVASEHRVKPVPPTAYCFVAEVDAALEEQVLHNPQ